MDKNTGLGLLVIVVILGGYMWWNSKNTTEYNKEQQRIRDSISRVEKVRELEEKVNLADETSDTIEIARKKNIAIDNLGETLASSMQGSEEFFTVENEKLKLTFTNKGARIWAVEFKNYQNYTDFKAKNNNPLKMFSGDENKFSLELFAAKQNINTEDFYFEPQLQTTAITVSADSTKIPFRLYADSVSYMEFLYTIYKDSYKVGFDVNMVNMDTHFDQRASTIDVNWKLNLHQQEKGHTNENNYTTIAYKYPNDKSIDDLTASKSADDENIKTRLEWINFKQHFFSSILVTNGSVNNKLRFVSYKEDNPESLLKTCEANFQLEFNSRDKATNIPMEFYFVPNHFRTLKSYGHSFEKIIPLGGNIIGIINRAVVIPVFNFLGKFIDSFGLIILMLTILIKLLIMPLTWKSYMSSAKMKVLKPEVDKINAKYPDQKDAMKKQQEVMALYNKTGVKMLGGCLPMLLQFPILFALFRFFPSSFELRQQSFLWADDLSAYDSIINLPFKIPFYGDHISLFTILMAVALVISQKISMSQQSAANPQMKQMNVMMMYVMPVFMLVFFNNYSSGLTYYYFLSNVFTVVQNVVIRKYFVDEEALLKKLNERASKHQQQPSKKKKMSFTERLMKKQQELERQNKEVQKKKKK